MKRRYYNLLIDLTDSKEFLSELGENVCGSEDTIIVNFLNAHCFNIAQSDSDYHRALLDGTYLLNDGVGVAIGARLLGFEFKENLNGTDLIPKIIGLMASYNKKIFLLGAKKAVVEKAGSVISLAYPGIEVVGCQDGYFKDSAEVIEQINQSQADMVLVCMGVPKQEVWVAEHSSKLNHARLIVSGGAVLDFLTGEVARAPSWWRRTGFEWFFRFLQEPRRLFKRYTFGNITFLFHVLRFRIRAIGKATAEDERAQ